MWLAPALILCSLVGMFVGMMSSHLIASARRDIQDEVYKNSSHNKDVLDRIEAQLYENIGRLKRNEDAMKRIEINSKRIDKLEGR